MASKTYPYLYDKQIHTHIGQFMRVFSGFQYDTQTVDGSDNPIHERIRVVYGGMDDIAAHILADGKDRPNVKLPVMSANLEGFGIDDNAIYAPSHEDEVISTNAAGAQQIYNKLVGPQLTMNMSLRVWASSVGQLFSILEQILLVFNREIAIRVSTDDRHADRHSLVKMTGIDNEIRTLGEGSGRMVTQTLNFEMPLILRYPITTDGKFIDTIIKRTVFVDEIGDATDDLLDDNVTTIDSTGIN